MRKPFSWWRQWWLVELLRFLFPRAIKEIVGEALTDALHPEFGSAWQPPDGGGWRAVEQARAEGWREMLDSIRSSLRDYPNSGGDIVVMQEVERIVAEAVGRANGKAE